MKTFYMKRSLMLLGAAAIAASTYADYVDVTHKYLKDAAYLPAWQGVVSATREGVAEIWNGAFRTYQVLPDMPAGEYTLTVNAFYRCGNNDYSREHMKGADVTPELYTASIFINNTKKSVAGLFDGGLQVAPNSMEEANAAFESGQYLNTVTANHPGGDLVIGIMNTGSYHDEWCCFDNFKLVGPDGVVEVPNGDFSEVLNSKLSWNNVNNSSEEKTPDMQKDNSGGGDYRKCGGSPYKYGQQVELPAGKYRFGMLCFHRYGSESDAAGNYYNHKWPCDIVAGAYGSANRTPEDWFKANDYDTNTDYDHAYIFMSKNADCPKDLNWSEDLGDLTEGADVRTRVKDVWEIHNGDLAAMPHNNPVRIEGNLEGDWVDVIPYETRNKVIYRHDSGDEREAAAAFVNDPEKYYQYVEFELTEPTKVWVGMGKNSQTGDGYWHAWADQTLKMYVDNGGEEPKDEPVYFNSFEDEDLNGAKIVGDGEIKDLGGAYGKVFSNAMDGKRQNYLLLPEDILTHSADTQELTILFWVNRGNETDAAHYPWCPAFTAYGSAPSENNDNTWPMLACQYRGVLQVNNTGWCDYKNEENVKGVNTLYNLDNDWLADGGWHLYAASFTPKTAKVSFDGKVVNEWIIPAEADNTAAGLFTNGADLKYICLGGNQAWDWNDPDPGFWFDDFAIYNKVLSADEINSIIKAKVGEGNAVEAISTANGAVEYYNLQGVRVANPENGIYIVREGNKISKKVIR